MKNLFSQLQNLGRALMLPVSVLPVAGILLGVGGGFLSSAEKSGWDIPSSLELLLRIMESAGAPIFGSLALLFAIGVALGFTKNDGVAALSSVVGFVVLQGTMGTLAKVLGVPTSRVLGIESIDTGVLGGIVAGLIAATLFNRFYRMQLPDYLGFFSGKRFVPIVTAFGAIVAGVILSFVWPPVGSVINAFSHWASSENPVNATGIYGVVERLLIPFGLHHIWNVPFFFEIGQYYKPLRPAVDCGLELFRNDPESCQLIRGEITRFFANDPSAGIFGGGYLFKMFGLPAAALAIWHSAHPSRRATVGSLMVSAAITSFLTGITEPIEFSFMFVAPVLYGVHALLSGMAFVVMNLADVRLGFAFSHGFIDYILHHFVSGLGHKAFMALVFGLPYAALYYFVFKGFIKFFNLKTPGREAAQTQAANESAAPQTTELAQELLKALGGAENIRSIEACITRLRLELVKSEVINKERIKELGAAGVFVAGHGVQAVFGTRSDELRRQIDDILKKSS